MQHAKQLEHRLIQAMRWPFEAICDRAGRPSEWVMLHGPVVARSHHAQFAALRRAGARFVGMTSYFDFPRHAPRDGLDYEAVCEAWCHCFREPHCYLRGSRPRALVSASDFTDWTWTVRVAAGAQPFRSYELVYVGAAEPWQRQAKNWPLAARCLPALCRELGMQALVIGSPDAILPPQPRISFCKALDWPTLLATVAAARLLFVPNGLDPSPRIVAEALCLDVPVLMHGSILGGWKYVNRYTGCFFDDERDVVDAAHRALASGTAPRDWFRGNFGPEVSSRRLTALLRQIDPTLGPDNGCRITAAGPTGRQVA